MAAFVVACAPVERADDTAVIASGADLESGNPLVTVHPMSRQVQRHALFVTLVRLDSALQPVPYFARSWNWNSTRDAVRFDLHRTLRWHDGRKVTAADVAFTLDAVRDPELGSPRAGDLTNVSRVTTDGDSVVTVQFNTSLPLLPSIFAELPIVPRHILDSVPRKSWRAHAFSTSPVGNGPFRFADRMPGRRWRFVRNDDFPAELGGPPALGQLVIAVVDEAATKFAGLVSGELDMAGVSPVMAHLVEADPMLELLTPPVLFSNVLAFNTTRAPFDDARVRRAISLSVDRKRIIDAAVAGYATAAGSALPPGLPVSVQGNAEQNTGLADSLLDAAGWKRGNDGMRSRNGVPFRFELLTVSTGDLAVEQLVQADLRLRGIDVSIRVAEMVAFLTRLRAAQKDFDVAITGIPGDMALGHLSAMFSGAQRGGALDYTGWHDVTMDAALQAARTSAAGPQLLAAWQRVDSILVTESPVVWIYHSRGVQGKARTLRNVTMDLRGELVSVTKWRRERNDR